MEKWKLKMHEPEYLDGIRCTATISEPRPHFDAPIAYGFDEAKMQLAALAPEMRHMLETVKRFCSDECVWHAVLDPANSNKTLGDWVDELLTKMPTETGNDDSVEETRSA